MMVMMRMMMKMMMSQSVLWAAVVLSLVSFEAGWLIVLVQVRLEREAFVAAFAGVVLEGWVRLHVSAEVGAVGEGLAAMGAGEWFLPCVGPHVTLQEPGPAKGFTTHCTLMLQVMGQHVHRQRRHGHVHLVAGGTLPGLLAVQAAVCLLVSAQIRRGGVRLAALSTHITTLGFAFDWAGVFWACVLAAVRLTATLAGTPLVGSPAGASVRNEEGVDGVLLQLWAAAVWFSCSARHGAIRMFHIMVGELLTAAATCKSRGVQGTRGEPGLLTKWLLFALQHWGDAVVMDVAWEKKRNLI